MAASTYGTAHIFGVGQLIASGTIVSADLNSSFDLNDTVTDGNGVVIHTRRDSRVYGGSITVRFATAPTVAIGNALAVSNANISAHNATYEVTQVGEALSSRSFAEVTFTIERHESVAVS